MLNKATSREIVEELNKLNGVNSNEQEYFSKILTILLEDQETAIKPEDVFIFVDSQENLVKESNLIEESKIRLYFSLEILRYSYALWYENIQE